MGDVALLTSTLQAALRGEPVDPAKLLRFVRTARGMPANKIKAGGAALLFTDAWSEGVEALDSLLVYEEHNGPRAKEPLAPDTKAGVYSIAEVALVTAADLPRAKPRSVMRRLADRQLALTGQRLALYDLIATPDGDVTGLPGVRSNSPKGPTRMCETMEYRVLTGKPQRGDRGVPRRLDSWKPASDEQAIFSAPAHWWTQLIDGPMWSIARHQLRRCLPCTLPLALVTYRWDGGTLAYFERPDDVRPWLTRGSAAANKDADRVEDVCSSVLVTWGKPGKHQVEAVLSWKRDPPVERVPAGAVRTRVAAVGEAR